MSRSLRHSLVALLTLACSEVARAVDFYVDAAVAGPGAGTQVDPFRTVQAAIDAAASGDVIRVALGTYTQNLRIDNKNLVLEGGYTRSFVRDVANNQTTLAGTGGNAVVNLIMANVTLDGFRITGGTGSTEELPNATHGGGIYSRDGSVTINNCLIEGNDIRSMNPPAETNRGGGLHVDSAPMATITNNIIRNNFGGRGAGISVTGGAAALIQGNVVENNIAVGDHGGGLFIGVTNATITQNVIRGNEIGRALGYGWGGGLIVFNPGNSAEISFNVVSGNFAAAYGAGIFIDEGATADIHHELVFRNVSRDGCEAVSAIAVDGGEGVGSAATIRHCTVANNVCANATRGNGLQVEGGSTATVSNSIFWNNGGDDFAAFDTATLAVTFTDSQEAIAGNGNISADPLFMNEAADDYRPVAGSPAIDAADPASPFADEPAPNGGRADMGRFGGANDLPPPMPPTGGNTGGANNGGCGAGGALCPMAALFMVMASVLGVRRAGRARRARIDATCRSSD